MSNFELKLRTPDADTKGVLGFYAALEDAQAVVTALATKKIPSRADIQALIKCAMYLVDESEREAAEDFLLNEASANDLATLGSTLIAIGK